MSRTSRVLASASLGYVQMVLVTVVGLWFTPFLLRHVGQHDFGLWSVATPILAYVGFIEFGILTILQRDVSFALGEAGGERRAVPAIDDAIGSTMRLVLYQVPAFALAIAVVIWRLPAEWVSLRGPLTITLVVFAATFPLRIYHALLMGLQDLQFLGVVNIASWVLGTALNVILVMMGHGLYALAISWACIQVVTYGASVVRAGATFGYGLAWPTKPVRRQRALLQFRKGFWVIVSQVAVMLVSGTDVVVVASVMGPAAVTPYSITDKLVTMFNNVPLQILSISQPGLSELSSSESRSRLADVCIALTRLVLLVSGLVAVLVVALNGSFVRWWVGDHEYAGAMVGALLALSMMLGHWTATVGYALFSFGYERFVSLVGLVQGAITVSVTILATRHLGLVGATLGSVVAYVAVLPPLLLVLARATGTTVRSQVVAVLVWAWRLALLGVGAALLARHVTPRTVFGLSVVGALVVCAYALVMAPLALNGPLGGYTRPRLTALLARIGTRTRASL